MDNNVDELRNMMQGFNNMAARLKFQGGQPQQHRMIKDKWRTFQRALLYSYQGAFVKDVYKEDMDWVRCLINPNKLKMDYDDKIISIDFRHNFKAGTVFDWMNTGTKWLILTQDLTELAYFLGDIRRCRYEIKWIDENGDIKQTYAAVRGPVETRIEFIQKNKDSLDKPNLSINFYVPYNDDNYKHFTRYQKFYLQEDTSICWRVEAINSISTPGIIEITAVEYYSNETLDDVKHGLVNGLVNKIEDPNPQDIEIIGETFIKSQIAYEYSCALGGVWSVDKKYPVEITKVDDNTIKLKWTRSYSGQFILKCGEQEKTIVVQSLFE